MADVFISYRRDPSSPMALAVKYALENSNISAFLDTQDMKARRFDNQIQEEITEAGFFVCLLSNSTLESDYVRQEIECAYEHKKPMISVFHENYKPNKQLKWLSQQSIYHLIHSNGVQLFDKKGHYLVEALKKIIDLIKTADHDAIKLRDYKLVEIEMDVPYNGFDAEQFIIYLAGITMISYYAIQLITILSGSVIAKLEMPESSAELLVALHKSGSIALSKYNLKSVKIIDKPRTKLFIGHSFEDRGRAEKLSDFYLGFDNRVFNPSRELPLTDNWLQAVFAAIDESDLVAFVISSVSLRSHSMQMEIEYALKQQKEIKIAVTNEDNLELPDYILEAESKGRIQRLT